MILLKYGYQYVIEFGGKYEKNLKFDNELLIRVLMMKVKGEMISFYYRRSHELSLDVICKGKVIDISYNRFLADERYTPESVLVED